MKQKHKGAMRMTDTQTQQFLEALKIIAEKSKSPAEIAEAIAKIQNKGKKKAR